MLKAKLADKEEKLDFKAEEVLLAMQRGIRRDLRRLFDADGRPLPLHTLTAADQAIVAGYEVILKNAEAGDGHIGTC